MTNIPTILAYEFEKLRQETVAAYEASGMMATGNWGREVKVELGQSGAALTAPAYLSGRKPGTPPPSEAIEKWIVAKGIAAKMEADLSISSLAFLIARKIGREGWKPKEGDIMKSVLTPGRLQDILEDIGDSLLEDFTTHLLRYLKTTFA